MQKPLLTRGSVVDLAARFLNLARNPPPSEDTTTRTLVPDGQPIDGVKFLRQIQKRLPVEDILDLLEAYRSGDTVAQLTRNYGINRTTVLDHLQRNEVPRRPHVRKLTDNQVTEASALYADGWSHSRLGKRFFVSAETIRKELIKAGVQSRPAGRPAGQPPQRRS